MNGSIKIMVTAAGLFVGAGCMRLDLGHGMLGCSSNGNCPAPYHCVQDLCVADRDGGAAPHDGGQIIGTPLATFDTDGEGFAIANWNNPTTLNLGSLSPNPVMLAWDQMEGNPTAGSLKVTVPFTDYNQEVEVIKAFWDTPQDWTGKTLHVRMKLASGGDPEGVYMGVALALLSATEDDAGTPEYHAAYRSFTARETSDWQEFAIYASDANISNDPDWDPMNVGQLSINVMTSNPVPRPAAKPTTAVIYIDSLSLSSDQ